MIGVMTAKRIQASKFLSLLLRHKPETIGLTLDAHGWAVVDELVARTNAEDIYFTPELLEDIARHCDKQRFELSDDKTRIRCRQGHSVNIEHGLQAQEPPVALFHGTAERFLAAILAEGLQRRQRHHVHLSADTETARAVGMRHGHVVILKVNARAMYDEGHSFYCSSNGVWLVDEVPAAFLTVESSADED